MNLSAARWQRIHEAQARELDALLHDRDYALAMAKSPHYSRIGDWIERGSGRALEIGCGPGRYVALLAHLGHEVIGCDPIKYETWVKFEPLRSVQFMAGVRAESIPFPDGHFDHVACMGALLYFADPRRALQEIRRVLKPGGRLIVRTVNRNNLKTLITRKTLDPGAPNQFNLGELEEFLRAGGFSVSHSMAYGFWPPIANGWWWYVSNCSLSVRSQLVLSSLTPRQLRVSMTVFAERPS
jgi:SAM-dependent methyltransferase